MVPFEYVCLTACSCLYDIKRTSLVHFASRLRFDRRTGKTIHFAGQSASRRSAAGLRLPRTGNLGCMYAVRDAVHRCGRPY